MPDIELATALTDLGASKVTTLLPTSDNHITGSSRDPAAVHETDTKFEIGDPAATWGVVALMTFDISSLVGTDVRSAILRLVRDDTINSINTDTLKIRVRKMLRAYVPSEVTGVQWSVGNNWTTALAEGVGSDVSASHYGFTHFPRAGVPAAGEKQFLNIDLTGMVREAIGLGETVLRLHLRGNTTFNGSNTILLHSLESPDEQYRPRLSVVHT